MEPLQREKNYGVELLRIFAAVLVLLLHILGVGGVYPYAGSSVTASQHAANYVTSWTLETAAYGAVDLFALISGFVGLYSSFKPKRWLRLWALCVFWGVVTFVLFDKCVVVFRAFNDLLVWMIPDVSPTVERLIPAASDYFDVIFTVGTKQFWYFNMYTLLFCLTPILNAGLRKLDKKQLALTSFVLFFAASAYKTAFDRDLFVLGGGYSAIWLLLLYVVGATAKKYYDDGFRPNRWLCALGYLACVGISAGFKFWFEWLYAKHPDVTAFKDYSGVLISYTGPLIVLGSVLLLFAFVQLNVRTKTGRKIVLTFAGASFGIYIIQVTTPFWYNYLQLRFYRFAFLPTGEMVLSLFGALFAVYLLLAALEIARICLFRYSRFDKLIDLAGDGITKLVERAFLNRKRKDPPAEDAAPPSEAEKDPEPSTNLHDRQNRVQESVFESKQQK